MATDEQKLDAAFRVSLDQHLLEGLVHNWPGLWRWLGDVETWALRDKLASINTESPVYVAGLARSGSTILLEFLAAHPHVATHQYRDFPLIFTPVWSHELQRRTPTPPVSASERAHGDGLMITPESPEAMEEALWMASFADAHNPAQSQVLGSHTENARFERFYREHLQKIVYLRGGYRYVSKGNYNITRLPYLRKLLPDLRVVIPIRRPVGHIASLMKQQRLFVAGESRHPRALRHMQRVGHFEFGLDRRPINVGNPRVTSEIIELWNAGDEVRGWARYWASVYGWVREELKRDEALDQAATIVRFEDLCDDPRGSLTQLLQHVQLEDNGLVDAFAGRIHAPTYYRADFTDDELAVIQEETGEVAAAYGYEPDDSLADPRSANNKSQLNTPAKASTAPSGK